MVISNSPFLKSDKIIASQLKIVRPKNGQDTKSYLPKATHINFTHELAALIVLAKYIAFRTIKLLVKDHTKRLAVKKDVLIREVALDSRCGMYCVNNNQTLDVFQEEKDLQTATPTETIR